MCSTIKLHTFVFSILSVCYVVHGINFHLQPNTQKCLREELNQHTLINGEYTVVDAIGQSVDYVVSFRNYMNTNLKSTFKDIFIVSQMMFRLYY